MACHLLLVTKDFGTECFERGRENREEGRIDAEPVSEMENFKNREVVEE